jgi:hypothetical protein
MTLLRKAAEFLEVSSKISNPELWQKASSLTTEALHVSTMNLELRKRVAELERHLQEAQAKLELAGKDLLDVAATRRCLQQLKDVTAKFEQTEAPTVAEAVARNLYQMCGAAWEPVEQEVPPQAKAASA